jgi:hypothetical protein
MQTIFSDAFKNDTYDPMFTLTHFISKLRTLTAGFNQGGHNS